MAQKKEQSFLKKDDPLFSYSVDMLIISFCLLIIGTFLNGIMAILQALVCISVFVICEYLGFRAATKSNPLGDLSAIWEGLIISLMLPACAPLWAGAVASAFAALVAKLPFGGLHGAPFVPTAAGIAFINLCCPEIMNTFAASSFSWNIIFSTSNDFIRQASILNMLHNGTNLSLSTFNAVSLLSGTYPGATGCTCILALIGIMVYILFRRPGRLISTLGYLTSSAIFAGIFSTVSSSVIDSVVFELCAGSLIFTAVLIINDPVTSPKKPFEAFIYGAVAGFIYILLRRFAKIEDPSSFGILMMNAIWPVFKKENHIKHKIYTKHINTVLSTKSNS